MTSKQVHSSSQLLKVWLKVSVDYPYANSYLPFLLFAFKHFSYQFHQNVREKSRKSRYPGFPVSSLPAAMSIEQVVRVCWRKKTKLLATVKSFLCFYYLYHQQRYSTTAKIFLAFQKSIYFRYFNVYKNVSSIVLDWKTKISFIPGTLLM